MHGRDQQFHTDVGRRDLHETSNLVRGGGHSHLKYCQIVVIRAVTPAHHLQNRKRQTKAVVIIALTLEYSMTALREDVCCQLFRGCLTRAACDSNYGTRPPLV